ncbi:MAG: hypothetical protein JNL83_36175 [Myxococcales bacterium]|nr:hypothetical protein [Myxococcales bacterium]
MYERELDAIFADPTHEDAQDRIEQLMDALGWKPARDYVLSVLEAPDRTVAQWQLAAAVVWWLSCDKRELPVHRVIALVYARLPHDEGSGENNLAWSIASTLEQKSYLSSYDPLADPRVVAELATVSRRTPPDR